MNVRLASCLVALILALGGAHVSATSGPDLAVTVSARFDPLNVGADETFTVQVTNLGASDAPATMMTDTLPLAGVAVLATSATRGACSPLGHAVRCITSTLPTQSSVTFAITVSTTTPAGGVITDTTEAQTFANGFSQPPLSDPTPGNNSALLSVPVVSPVPPVTTDLQVTGASNQGSPRAGSSFVLTWQVKNNQDQTANGVRFSTTLPSDVAVDTVVPNVGTCSGPPAGSAGGTVTCTMDGLAKGQTQLLTLDLTAGTALGSVPITGTVTFNGTDPNPANNTFTVTVKIQ